MRKEMFFVMAVFMLLSVGKIQAEVSTIVNGSFEDDGMINNIATKEPNGWDVNMPPSKFGGWVLDDWPTDGNYNLTLVSNWYTAFEVNDMAEVSQDVYLWDVNAITFDIQLDTYPANPWNPQKRMAAVLIDDVIVWESNSVGSDVRGEYFDQVINIEALDLGIHKLSLALISKVKESWSSVTTRYYTDWDNIRIGFYCDGNGFLPGDFNRDCFVDFIDYAMLANVWLENVDPDSKYNLYPDDVVNLSDLEVFIGDWLKSSYD